MQPNAFLLMDANWKLPYQIETDHVLKRSQHPSQTEKKGFCYIIMFDVALFCKPRFLTKWLKDVLIIN